ncbi:MAG: helix-hairpin-helix domain-containing protein, partial [Candidatus Omnitrophota bacterium]
AVDLARASREDLLAMPGIGEKRADAILALRQAQGGSLELEDLKNIKGLNDAMLERIKPYVKESKP